MCVKRQGWAIKLSQQCSSALNFSTNQTKIGWPTSVQPSGSAFWRSYHQIDSGTLYLGSFHSQLTGSVLPPQSCQQASPPSTPGFAPCSFPAPYRSCCDMNRSLFASRSSSSSVVLDTFTFHAPKLKANDIFFPQKGIPQRANI